MRETATFEVAHNKFSDWTAEELAEMEVDYSNIPRVAESSDDSEAEGKSAPRGAPTTHDWRDSNGVNFVSPVKDQGTCGSSVAMTNIAAAESKFKIDHQAG